MVQQIRMNHLTGKSILITGGAGFLGSNLAHCLCALGAKVRVLDSFHPDYGANSFNLKSLDGKLEIIKDSILNEQRVTSLLEDSDGVFHFAAQCSHVDSMTDPWLDLEYNSKGTLVILEAARKSKKKPFIIYAGTRAQIGAAVETPVSEHTRPNPTDIYGVNKLAAEMYGSVYSRVHGIPFVSLRFTNCYGARHQMKNPKYGILNWFVSLALQGKPIKVFGTGQQLRDYLYVEDAVDAMLAAGKFISETPKSDPKIQISGDRISFYVFNIASGRTIPFVDCAKKIAEYTGATLEMVPWPKDREAIETGDFVADISAAEQILKWKASTSFDVGLQNTIQFYKENLKAYL